PPILQWQELVHVGAGVDHALVIDRDTRGASVDGTEAGGVGLRRFLNGSVDSDPGIGFRFGPVEHFSVSFFFAAHWQASHSGSSMAQALPHAASALTAMGPLEAGAAAMTEDTAFSLPSVPF